MRLTINPLDNDAHPIAYASLCRTIATLATPSPACITEGAPDAKLCVPRGVAIGQGTGADAVAER